MDPKQPRYRKSFQFTVEVYTNRESDAEFVRDELAACVEDLRDSGRRVAGYTVIGYPAEVQKPQRRQPQ